MQKGSLTEFEQIANEFVLLVKKCIRRYYRPHTNEGYQKYDKRELQLMDEFFKIKSEVNAASNDATSIDVQIIIDKMCQLIGLGEAYICEMEKDGKIPNCLLLRNIAAYMTCLLKIFGSVPENVDYGFSTGSSETITYGTSPSTPAHELIMPYVSALTAFRGTISDLAQQCNVTDIIKECNRIKDEVLPELGVILNEQDPEKPVLIDAGVLKQCQKLSEYRDEKTRQIARSQSENGRRRSSLKISQLLDLQGKVLQKQKSDEYCLLHQKNSY